MEDENAAKVPEDFEKLASSTSGFREKHGLFSSELRTKIEKSLSLIRSARTQLECKCFSCVVIYY